MPGALELVPAMESAGIACAFITNSSILSVSEIQSKLARMGIGVDAERILTSGEATAHHLKTVARPGDHVLVVGEEALAEAVARAGLAVTDDEPCFVVVGLDRRLTYARLAVACRAINRGAAFIACNADPAYPVEDGLTPGTGAITAAITAATGIAPVIVGKPAPTMVNCALERLGVGPGEAAVVGDQVESDVRAGQAAGTRTIWVSSDTRHPAAAPAPDWTVRDLREMLELFGRGPS